MIAEDALHPQAHHLMTMDIAVVHPTIMHETTGGWNAECNLDVETAGHPPHAGVRMTGQVIVDARIPMMADMHGPPGVVVITSRMMRGTGRERLT